MYGSLEIAVPHDSNVFDNLRHFLEPHRAITEEELATAKNDARRMEQAILILKMQIQSHPMFEKEKTGETTKRIPRNVANAEKQRLGSEISRIESDIGKYMTVTKAILDDLVEIHGTNCETMLRKLNASRTLQQMLV